MKRISFFLLSLPVLTRADSALVEQLQATKGKVIEAEQAERQLLGTLYTITQRMKDMSKKRDRMTDRKFVVEKDVRSLSGTIALLEQRVNTQRQGLRRRMRGLYLLNGQTALRSLFSSQSSVEFDRNLRFLKRVTDRDYGLIKDYERSLGSLRRKRRQLDAQVRHLARIQDALERQEAILAKDQIAKGGLLAKLKASRSHHLDQLRELRAKAGGVETAMAELDTAFFEKRGELAPPIDGPLVKRYGSIQDEEFDLQLAHKGLFFSAGQKTPVRSVYDGRVAFAGELPGYGLSLIVDHGDHYYSVYGHLLTLEKSTGDRVAAGTQIGLAGGRSPWFGTGLYFEIRHFSDAIDPQPWLKQM